MRARHTTAAALVALSLAAGCSDEPRRFLGEDATVSDQPAVDVGRDAGPEASLDVAGDLGDLDAGLDAAEAGLDATIDAGPRDVVSEPLVRLCMRNDECGSPALYCNGPGCGAAGFCVPRPAASSCDTGSDAGGERVCGCDGMSYPSLCALQLAGERLRAVGDCPRD